MEDNLNQTKPLSVTKINNRQNTYSFLLFLLLNFLGLALGGIYTSQGISSDWYENLYKAPWTPPGWVFGAAWTSIMILFSFYMKDLFTQKINLKMMFLLYFSQWILNLIWNPIFFYFQATTIALIVITVFTILLGFIISFYYSVMKLKSLLLLPYFIWILIATSLNGFIVLYN